MKKFLLPITAAIILGSLFLLIAILSGIKQPTQIIVPSLPTPTPIQPAGFVTSPLKLLASIPENGAVGVGDTDPIVFTFNQFVATDSVRFSLFPPIDYVLNSRLDALIVTPTTPYEENLVYTYSLFDLKGNLLTTATFSAGASPSPVVPLTGRYPNLDIVADSAQQEDFPDVFLATYVPYQNDSFSVTSTFSTTPKGHYVFTVTPNSDAAKQAFLSWLKQLGLNQEEIDRLEVTYSNG